MLLDDDQDGEGAPVTHDLPTPSSGFQGQEAAHSAANDCVELWLSDFNNWFIVCP
jgi:hypothetical protein